MSGRSSTFPARHPWVPVRLPHFTARKNRAREDLSAPRASCDSSAFRSLKRKPCGGRDMNSHERKPTVNADTTGLHDPRVSDRRQVPAHSRRMMHPRPRDRPQSPPGALLRRSRSVTVAFSSIVIYFRFKISLTEENTSPAQRTASSASDMLKSSSEPTPRDSSPYSAGSRLLRNSADHRAKSSILFAY